MKIKTVESNFVISIVKMATINKKHHVCN